jgi:hypothetical protein
LFAKVYYIALAMITGLHYGIAAYNRKRRDLGFGDIIAGVIFALTWPLMFPFVLMYATLVEGGFIESSRKQ